MRPLMCSLVLSAVSLACADSPTSPIETPTPAFAAANAEVVRGPFRPGVLFGPEAELAVAVGFEEPFAAHCADLESPDQPGSGKAVITPPGNIHFNQSGKGLNVVVFEFQGEVTDYCQDLVGAPVVASGTADFTLTSKNLIPGLGGAGPGTDQVRVTVHGVVDLASGGQARLLATTHVLIRPDGSFKFDHTRIILKPL